MVGGGAAAAVVCGHLWDFGGYERGGRRSFEIKQKAFRFPWQTVEKTLLMP